MSSAEWTEEAEKIHNEGTEGTKTNGGTSSRAPASGRRWWSEKDRQNKHLRNQAVLVLPIFFRSAPRKARRDCSAINYACSRFIETLRSSSFASFLRCEPRSLRPLRAH